MIFFPGKIEMEKNYFAKVSYVGKKFRGVWVRVGIRSSSKHRRSSKAVPQSIFFRADFQKVFYEKNVF